MRLRTILVMVLAAAALGTAAFVGLAQTATPVLKFNDAQPTREALEECEKAPDGQAVRQCLYARLYGFGLAHGLKELNRVMDMQVKSPVFLQACHETGHRLGKDLYAEYADDLARAIPDHLHACEGSILHGVLDGAALAQPVSEEQLRRMVATCEKNDVTYFCADGVGSLSWTQTQDFDLSLGRCDWFTTDSTRRDCVEGILMRLALPQLFSGTRKYTADELAALCVAKTEQVRESCAIILGYSLFFDTLETPLFATGITHPTRADMPALARMLDPTDAACGKLGEPYGGKCRMHVGSFLSRNPAGGELGLALVCARLPQDLWAACSIPNYRKESGIPLVQDSLIAELAADPDLAARPVADSAPAPAQQPAPVAE